MSPSRRAERRAAAFLLYQHDLTGRQWDDLFDAYHIDTGEPVSDWTRREVQDVWDARGDLDGRIDEAAQGWPAERLAVLERNVLRLGLHELLAGAVPAAVAIDEAVSIAKRYASPEASGLVNGILGRIARGEGVGR